MSKNKNSIQGLIAPGPNGVYRPVVRPTMSSQENSSSQGSQFHMASPIVASTPTVQGDAALLLANSNFAEVVQATVDSNYCHRLLKDCGGPETFMECWDERAIPKLRPSATGSEQKLWKQKKEMKNQCSKILLAVTRLSFFDQYLLMPSKRLNCIPEFDKYC